MDIRIASIAGADRLRVQPGAASCPRRAARGSCRGSSAWRAPRSGSTRAACSPAEEALAGRPREPRASPPDELLPAARELARGDRARTPRRCRWRSPASSCGRCSAPTIRWRRTGSTRGAWSGRAAAADAREGVTRVPRQAPGALHAAARAPTCRPSTPGGRTAHSRPDARVTLRHGAALPDGVREHRLRRRVRPAPARDRPRAAASPTGSSGFVAGELRLRAHDRAMCRRAGSRAVGLGTTLAAAPALLVAAACSCSWSAGPFPVLVLGRVLVGFGHSLGHGWRAHARSCSTSAARPAPMRLNVFEFAGMAGVLGGLAADRAPARGMGLAAIADRRLLAAPHHASSSCRACRRQFPDQPAVPAGDAVARASGARAPAERMPPIVWLMFAVGIIMALAWSSMSQFLIPLRGTREFGARPGRRVATARRWPRSSTSSRCCRSAGSPTGWAASSCWRRVSAVSGSAPSPSGSARSRSFVAGLRAASASGWRDGCSRSA